VSRRFGFLAMLAAVPLVLFEVTLLPAVLHWLAVGLYVLFVALATIAAAWQVWRRLIR
jgi:hypothetical protein